MPELFIHANVMEGLPENVNSFAVPLKDAGFSVTKRHEEKARSTPIRSYMPTFNVPFTVKKGTILSSEELLELSHNLMQAYPGITDLSLRTKTPVVDFPMREAFENSNPRDVVLSLHEMPITMEFRASTQYITSGFEGFLVKQCYLPHGQQQARRYLAAMKNISEEEVNEATILGAPSEAVQTMGRINSDAVFDIRENAFPELYLLKGSFVGKSEFTGLEIEYNKGLRGQHLAHVRVPILA